MRTTQLLAAVSWLAVGGLISSELRADEVPLFPGKRWETKTPAEVGLDVEKLKEFSQYVGGRGCVVRHGYLVYSWGDVGRRADVASACKPFYSHLLFKALEDEKIESLDEKVVRWEPRLRTINKELASKDAGITWRHFANQTSCYQLVERPGTAFAYNDWQMALFWDTLFLKVFGATYSNVDEKVLHRLLTDSLQCQDNPTMMAFGTSNRPGRVGISVRDFARFGLLYLHQGNWNGKQLISKKHAIMAITSPLPNSIPRAGRKAAEMISRQRSIGSGSKPDNQTDHHGSYSWLWWINGVDRNEKRKWPDAPSDTFGAFGHGGPRSMWVMPGLDIVVSYNDAKLRDRPYGEKSGTNQAMKRLVAACIAEPKQGENGAGTLLPSPSQANPLGHRPGSRRNLRSSPSHDSSSGIFSPRVGKVTTVASNAASVRSEARLTVENGWYVHDGRIVWGYGQHNGWWRSGQRPNITRNAPGKTGPNRTEDLDKLTDAMLRCGYPGFEHNFGLWYDRRRDKHDSAKRTNVRVVPPFLEQPWARSRQGTAWDGLSKYDLTKYNDWYFQRLKQFADLCDEKGTILFHNCYMQHALLETNSHYVDFPWRPENCIQSTGMPNNTPAANVFYDISHPLRRRLHRDYIRKCLDVLGKNSNVVFLCSEEYTGPLSFMRFWLETVFEWERETGRDVHVALGATKDVLDAVLTDKKLAASISTIDLRYWWYEKDGQLLAPQGGKQVAGRYLGGVSRTSPEQFHRQIKGYRRRYPNKAIIHGIPGTRRHAWAALAAGGSMLIGQLPYPGLKDPPEYTSPQKCLTIQPMYALIREHLSKSLARTKPADIVLDDPQCNWCLSDGKRTMLVYALKGGRFRLNLADVSGTFRAKWFNPRTGELAIAKNGTVEAGGTITFLAADSEDWALWLSRINGSE